MHRPQVRARVTYDRCTAKVDGDTRIAATLTGASGSDHLSRSYGWLVRYHRRACREAEGGVRRLDCAGRARPKDIRKLVLGRYSGTDRRRRWDACCPVFHASYRRAADIVGASAANPFIYVGTGAAMVLSATLAT